MSTTRVQLTDGGYVEHWTVDNQLHLQKYDASGAKVGAEHVRTAFIGGDVLALPDGGFLAVGGYALRGYYHTVYIFDGGSNAVRSFQPPGYGYGLEISAAPDGSLLIASMESKAVRPTSAGVDYTWAPILTLYDASGAVIMGPVGLAGDLPQVTLLADGSFQVDWNDGGHARRLTIDPDDPPELDRPATPAVTLLDDQGPRTGPIDFNTNDMTPVARVPVTETGTVLVTVTDGSAETDQTLDGGIRVTEADVARGYIEVPVSLPHAPGPGQPFKVWVRFKSDEGVPSQAVYDGFAIYPAPDVWSATDDAGASTGLVPHGGTTDDPTLTVRIGLETSGKRTGEEIVLSSQIGGEVGRVTLTEQHVAQGYVDLTTRPLPDGTHELRAYNGPVTPYTVTVAGGGAAPTQVAVSTTRVEAQEGNSGATPFTFILTRTGDTSVETWVNWRAFGPTSAHAVPGDFAGGAYPQGSVAFAPGETTKSIVVNVAGDTIVEPNEEFVFEAVVTRGGSGSSTATGVILNDDSTGSPGQGQVINSPGPGSTLTGGSGNDTLNASAGPDVLTGGGGADVFAWAQAPWQFARITDFAVGTDRIDFSAPLRAAGYTGSDPVADGYIWITSGGAGGTQILFDPDGRGPNPQWPNYVINLDGVPVETVTWSRLVGDNGPPPPPPAASVGFSGSAVEAEEGQEGVRNISFHVYRSGETSGSISVNWTVTGSGTNPAGASDFAGGALPSGQITFAPGEQMKTILVPVAGDTSPEPLETFTVTLSGATGATIAQASIEGRIANDDGSSPPPTGEGQVINSPGPGSTLTGGNGNDTLNASQGSDVLTGGGGADVFAWAREPWSPAMVMDFTVGTDKLNLSALFQAAGYAGSDPIADGRIVLMGQDGDTLVLFDDDGAGGDWPNYIIRLEGVSASGLTWAQLAGGGSQPPPPSGEGQVINSPGPGSTLTGGPGNDTLNSSRGEDVLTGGGGADRFVFADENWAPARITDFQSGDKIDLSGVFDDWGYAGTDPFADGRLILQGDGLGNTRVLLDDDGPGGDWPNYVLFVEGAGLEILQHPSHWIFQ